MVDHRGRRTGAEYPYDELDRLWKVVLLHQFHDIIPGSSIAWVHRDTEADYAAVSPAASSGIIERSLASARRETGDGPVLAVNSSPVPPQDGIKRCVHGRGSRRPAPRA